MNWIDFAWPAMGGACLLLAMLHVWMWSQRSSHLAYLSFAVLALAVAVISGLEWEMLRSQSVDRYALLLRWVHPVSAAFHIALVVFILFDLRAGRLWLGAAACLARLAVLLPNFTTGVNLNFHVISALQPYQVWGGEFVSRPVGVPNPWMVLAQVSAVLMLVFLADAFVSAWRKSPGPERLRALRICGSFIVFGLALSAWTAATVTGVIEAPMVFTPVFMCVVLAVSHALGQDIIRTPTLAADLAGAEANLLTTRMHMAAATRAAGIGLWSSDPTRDLITLDQRARALVGVAPGEALTPDTLLALVHPDDLTELAAVLRDARQDGREYRSEFRVRRRDGSVLWLVATGRFDECGSGELHGALLDVTEHRLDEDRFRKVINASPTAMLVVEADGRIVFASEQTERVFGYSTKQLVGMNVDALVPSSLRASHAAARGNYASDALTRRMAPNRELYGLRSDGSEVPLEIGLNPIPSDHGPQFLASITDISERRQREREAAVQRDELAHLSRVALLSELSGSLAHELNQPLTAILSNAQAAARFLARSPPDLEEVRESLVNIVESDKRAGEVIRRLRAMLRKEPPEFRQLDLNEVVLDVLRIIRSDLLNRNVETRLELAQQLPFVHGDRVQLQQVLLNLIMNGTDAMAEVTTGRVLTLRTLVLASDGVEVQVADVGRGIPEGDLERIFSPFVTTKREGMGLGLAVCTTIVEGHRGRLWSSNNAGPGATLHLVLPTG
jgi:two-component system sensor kinase FixL